MPNTNETVALTRAAELDRLSEDCGDDANDALIRVGELLGGCSAGGFVHDLRRELAQIEDDTVTDWGARWPWLAAEVSQAREALARSWLDDANAIMETAEREALSEMPRWHEVYTAAELRERIYLAESEFRHAMRCAQAGGGAAEVARSEVRLRHLRDELTSRLDADARQRRAAGQVHPQAQEVSL